jgi:hypothetical protein
MRQDADYKRIGFQLYALQAMLDMWMRRCGFGEHLTVRVNGLGWR